LATMKDPWRSLLRIDAWLLEPILRFTLVLCTTANFHYFFLTLF
jgi:hypothetical protein